MKRCMKVLIATICSILLFLSPISTAYSNAAGAADFKKLTAGTTIPDRYKSYNIKISILGEGEVIKLPISDYGFEKIYSESALMAITETSAELHYDLEEYTSHFDEIAYFYELCYLNEVGMNAKSAKAFGQRYAKTELQALKDVVGILTPQHPETNIVLKSHAHMTLSVYNQQQAEAIRFQSEYLYQVFSTLANLHMSLYSEYSDIYRKNNDVPHMPGNQGDSYIWIMQAGCLPISPWTGEVNSPEKIQECFAVLEVTPQWTVLTPSTTTPGQYTYTVAHAQTAPTTATPAAGTTQAAAPAAGSGWVYAAANPSIEANNIGSVFYTENYYSVVSQAGATAFTNPATGKKYTDKQVADIIAGAAAGGAGYAFGAPADAVSALSTYDNSQIFWYDANNTLAMLTHSDALTLYADGSLADAAGNPVATAMK